MNTKSTSTCSKLAECFDTKIVKFQKCTKLLNDLKNFLFVFNGAERKIKLLKILKTLKCIKTKITSSHFLNLLNILIPKIGFNQKVRKVFEGF